MARKISHSLINGRVGAGTGGQGIKIEWDETQAGQRQDGDLHWKDVSESSLEYVPPVWYGDRGVFAGGWSNGWYNTMDYIDIATTGNATDFGDMIESNAYGTGCSNGARGVYQSGDSNLHYITFATTGNATDFGDRTVGWQLGGACSSGTRGVFLGTSDVIDYITIATTGNAQDFGDLTQSRSCTACGDGTRGVAAGGWFGGFTNIMDYITIDTTGNATDFGDLLSGADVMSATDGDGRGVIAGGQSPSSSWEDTIQYITISTTGNATDFGNLTLGRYQAGACSDNTTAVFGGGRSYASGTTGVNTIDSITIATTSNATDFGDLTQVRYQVGACSGD